MTEPEQTPSQGIIGVASIDPAIGVLAAGFARSLLNALPFSDSDPEAPPEFRAIRVVLLPDGYVTVSSTDRVSAYWQPIDTVERALDLDVLIDRDDAHLIADAIRGALRSASEADLLTARMRAVELRSETLLRVDVGRRRVDVSCLPTDLNRIFDVGELITRSTTGEVAPFAVSMNAKLLARLAKVQVELKEARNIVALSQARKDGVVRCDFADDIVVLLLPRRDPEAMA